MRIFKLNLVSNLFKKVLIKFIMTIFNVKWNRKKIDN